MPLKPITTQTGLPCLLPATRQHTILVTARTVLAVRSRDRIPTCNCRVAESPVTTGQESVATVPNDYASGYQAALMDIAVALIADGENGVRTWLADNLRTLTSLTEKDES